MPKKTKDVTIRYCRFELRKDSILCRDVSVVYGVLDRLGRIGELQRNFDNEDAEKVINIESIQKSEDFYQIIFKSAKYGYLTDYMNTMGHDRESDKGMDEGEKMLTHMCLRRDRNELLACIESNKNGIGLQMINAYLEHHLKSHGENYSLTYQVLTTRDIVDIIDGSKKIKEVQVDCYYSDMTRDDFANIYDDCEEHTYEMKFSNQRKGWLRKDPIKQLFSEKNASRYKRIRVSLRSANDEDLVIDSLMDTISEKIRVKLNSKGVVDSADILPKLEERLNNFRETMG